jgi:Phage integrase, N-terminal SAM-like domain
MQPGEGQPLVLVADPQPWYATTPVPTPDHLALEDEHTRILACAVGDHLPYELALRANEVAAQLQQPRDRARSSGTRGERGSAGARRRLRGARALAIAGSAAAPNTRRAYATSYRAFAAFLHARYDEASLQTSTLQAVAGWRDELTQQGVASSSVAQRVSAVRPLAAQIGADPVVRCAAPTSNTSAPARCKTSSSLGCSRARICSRRSVSATARSSRAGTRRSELARLTLNDIQERGRQPDARTMGSPRLSKPRILCGVGESSGVAWPRCCLTHLVPRSPAAYDAFPIA